MAKKCQIKKKTPPKRGQSGEENTSKSQRGCYRPSLAGLQPPRPKVIASNIAKLE